MGELVIPQFHNKNNYQSQFMGTFPVGVPMISAEPGRKEPRVYVPRTSQNVLLNPRSEIPGTLPFEILEYVAKNTDLCQICENILLNQISARRWDIVPADTEDKNIYTKEEKILKKFFRHPDGKHKERTWRQWIKKALKNITRYDAFCIYKKKDLKGNLYGLQIVDGSTIKIIIDSNGNKLLPPENTYQQIIHGSVRGEWNMNEMIYTPISEEIKGHYGISPVERIIIAMMKYLRKQQFDYAYYNEGAYPDGGLYALRPNDQSQWTPEQIEQFQADWNEEMADRNKRQSLKFIPEGDLHKTKEYKWDIIQEEWAGRMAALSYGIDPYTFIKQVNRSVADTEDRKQTEFGINPYIRFIEDFCTNIIQFDLGFETLAFKIIDEKLEDQKAKVDKNKIYLMSGVYNRNEIRREEGKEPIEGGNIHTVQVGNALIPIKDIDKALTIPADGTENSDNIGNIETEVRDLENKKEIEKSLNQYKNFLVKRFKENRNLLGYNNENLSNKIIKTVESKLNNINDLSEIIEIFKTDFDSEVEQDNKEKKQYWL